MSAIRTVDEASEMYEQHIKELLKNHQAELEKAVETERERIIELIKEIRPKLEGNYKNMKTNEEIVSELKEVIYDYGSDIDPHGVDDGDIEAVMEKVQNALEEVRREERERIIELIKEIRPKLEGNYKICAFDGILQALTPHQDRSANRGMKTPNYDIIAHCIAVIAKEYELDDKGTQSLARIVKATVDTYKPAPTKTDQQ